MAAAAAVRSRVDAASLWKTITREKRGSRREYDRERHLVARNGWCMELKLVHTQPISSAYI